MPARTRTALLDAVSIALTFAVLAVFVFPFAWIVLTSLRGPAELFANTFELLPRAPTLANYETLLHSDFPRFVLNSVIVCAPATVIAVTVSMLAAYAFSRRQFFGRDLLLLLVVFTQLFPFVVLITPLYVIFQRLGLVNTHVGLIIAYVATTIPFTVYMLLGYLDTIPRALDEAAIIDGCSTLQVIARVVLPVAWPGIAATAIYAFSQAWNELLFALTLLTRNELKTVPIGLASFFGEYTARWELVMTASVIATLPTLVFFLFLQRQLVSGLAAGSVKQ